MPANIRALRVVRKYQLSPNMIRIVLGGEELSDFPHGQESAYIKLLLPKTGPKTTPMSMPNSHDTAQWRQQMQSMIETKNVFMRSYSIRAFDEGKRELSLDFVNHGDHGPASAWAITAKEGDMIMVRDPGPVKLINPQADWFLLAGDMTALPAISVNLEKLPPHAKGHAFIEILHKDDQQDLIKPKGITCHWLVNPKPDTPNTILADAVKALDWQAGVASVWVACEFDGMRILRHYLKHQRQVNREQLYISSYWKMGSSDEGHKAAKKEDKEI